MGRRSREKKLRRQAKERQAIITAAAGRVAEKACGSCAFFDPTALEDDPDIVGKLVHCLKSGSKFACHDGFPTDETGHYEPTPAELEAAPTCAGFAAVRHELTKRADLTKDPGRLEVAIALNIARRARPCTG